MPSTTRDLSNVKLSICIATRNRAGFIGATLDSILPQLVDGTEIVVLDGASTDGTEILLRDYEHRHARLRYVRQDVNNGSDRDFDRAVELARGEYCWLMPDDDLVKPGAVAAVLNAISRDYSLVLVNTEYRNFDMSKVLYRDELGIASDTEYGATELDALFLTSWKLIRYIGCMVIKRCLWLSRDRERFYGCLFVHVGVVFQAPLPGKSLVMPEPFISVRMENQSWLRKWFDTFCVKWPSCVAALAVSEAAKQAACADEPWRRFNVLLLARAGGQYSLTEYRNFVRPRTLSVRERILAPLAAVLPGVMLNTILLFYYSVIRRRNTRSERLLLMQSPFYMWK